MRLFFRHFRLPKESQQIMRILDILSDQYFEDLQNGRCAERDQKTLLSQKAVLTTIFSLLNLHTDQHHPEIRRRMTEKEWLMNNEKMNDGEDFPGNSSSTSISSDAESRIYCEKRPHCRP